MRKSNKKVVGSTAATTMQLLTKFSKDEKTHRPEANTMINKKYTRSISSFGNQWREAPQKKNIFHQKLRSTLQRSHLTPIQNVTNIFSVSPKAHSDEQLLRDISDRFCVGKKILNQTQISQEQLNLLTRIEYYIQQIITQLLTLHQQKISQFSKSIENICLEYEQKLQKQKQQIYEQIQKGINDFTSQLGKKIITTNLKSLFSSKIFNEMEKEGIDVNTWISNSQVMRKFTTKMEDNKSCETQTPYLRKSSVFDRKRIACQNEFIFSEKQSQSEEISVLVKQNNTFR